MIISVTVPNFDEQFALEYRGYEKQSKIQSLLRKKQLMYYLGTNGRVCIFRINSYDQSGVDLFFFLDMVD